MIPLWKKKGSFSFNMLSSNWFSEVNQVSGKGFFYEEEHSEIYCIIILHKEVINQRCQHMKIRRGQLHIYMS